MLLVKVLERKIVIRFFGFSLLLAPLINTVLSMSLQLVPDKWTVLQFWKVIGAQTTPNNVLNVCSLLIGLTMLSGSKKSWKFAMGLLGAHIALQLPRLGQDLRASWIYGVFFLVNIVTFLFIADQLAFKQKKVERVKPVEPLKEKPTPVFSEKKVSEPSLKQVEPMAFKEQIPPSFPQPEFKEPVFAPPKEVEIKAPVEPVFSPPVFAPPKEVEFKAPKEVQFKPPKELKLTVPQEPVFKFTEPKEIKASLPTEFAKTVSFPMPPPPQVFNFSAPPVFKSQAVSLPPSTKPIQRTSKKRILVSFQGASPWAQLVNINAKGVELKGLGEPPPDLAVRGLELCLSAEVVLKLKFSRQLDNKFFFEFSNMDSQKIQNLNSWLYQVQNVA